MKDSGFVLLFGRQIGYTSVLYYLLLAAAVLFYYAVPKKRRWIVLFSASCAFYVLLFPDAGQVLTFGISVFTSWLFAILIREKADSTVKKKVLVIGIAVSALPLFVMDGMRLVNSVLQAAGSGISFREIIIPVGLSFYTLQMISYLSDVYSGKIDPQRNLLKYALFISFFPQLLQGPIPRYSDLSHQLTDGNDFDPDHIQRGFQLILWGFFLKFVIADKAGVIVDTVFGNYRDYSGCICLAAGILYSLQLYADFLSCTTLAQGAACLFGIRLSDNFRRPYFSVSIKDFWRRWHMSLSFWLRDYVYIPLGGNRRGKLRKYLNLAVTFLVSGLWHGGTLKYLFWGLLHAFYQIFGERTRSFRDRIWLRLGHGETSGIRHVCRVLGTSFWVMLAWIIFRAGTLGSGLYMIRSIFTAFHPWDLTGTAIFGLGLSQSECTVLLLSAILLFVTGLCQERNVYIGTEIMKLHTVTRYIIYLAAILVIVIFGTYGYGFNASDFIYRGF